MNFSKDSFDSLAEALKRYHESSKTQYYNFVRIQIGLLTSDLFCDILPTLIGANNLPPFFEMEEVMSLMKSSNKPSAVASLSVI
jgi:hypothetical protein